MKHQLELKIASLISILLFSLHWADDIAQGIDRGGISGIWGLVILALWLYATVVLTERPSGLVLILIASLLASVVPVLHMRGAGIAELGLSKGAPCSGDCGIRADLVLLYPVLIGVSIAALVPERAKR